MTNIFAYRATDPIDMKNATDPIGPENDRYLKKNSDSAGIVVAAWGTHGVFKDRGKIVTSMLSYLKCLGKTKDGHPKHPLYLRKDLEPIPY